MKQDKKSNSLGEADMGEGASIPSKPPESCPVEQSGSANTRFILKLRTKSEFSPIASTTNTQCLHFSMSLLSYKNLTLRSCTVANMTEIFLKNCSCGCLFCCCCACFHLVCF